MKGETLKVRFIGDIHGRYKSYAKIAIEAEKLGHYTCQIGDFGFSYGIFKHHQLSPSRHLLFAGNHDNYDKIIHCPNNLGDFGEICLPDARPFFFVRGAYSMDKHLRIEGRDWWRNEELDMFLCHKALILYEQKRPEIMVTHDCPNVARDEMLRRGRGAGYGKVKTRTGQMLQAMVDLHVPKLWIFGHWHRNTTFTLPGMKTKFICLGELEWLEV